MTLFWVSLGSGASGMESCSAVGFCGSRFSEDGFELAALSGRDAADCPNADVVLANKSTAMIQAGELPKDRFKPFLEACLEVRSSQESTRRHRTYDLSILEYSLPDWGPSQRFLRNDDHISWLQGYIESVSGDPQSTVTSNDGTVGTNNECCPLVRHVGGAAGLRQIPLRIFSRSIGDGCCSIHLTLHEYITRAFRNDENIARADSDITGCVRPLFHVGGNLDRNSTRRRTAHQVIQRALPLD